MLQFDYNIDTDENGVFDGREIAKALISDAFRFLIPYAKGCPACADNLFSALANDAISEEHAYKADGQFLDRAIVFFDPQLEETAKADAWEAHIEATKPTTVELLRSGDQHNHAHDDEN